jgi:biotin transport system substrate-specific component
MNHNGRSLAARATVSSPAASSAVKTVVASAGAVALLALLTAVGAHIRIPLQPVPITLQTLFVLLAGALAGPALGFLSQGVYLAGGVLGIPLLAGSAAGLAVLSGPTGGYLVGFVAAAWFVGRFIGKRSGFGWSVFVFAAGSAIILALGVLHLALFAAGDLSTAIRVGFLPFVPGDAAKTLAAASIYGSYRRLRAARSAN